MHCHADGHMDAVFIGLHLLSVISGGFRATRARVLAALWRPAETFGGYLGPLQDDATMEGAFWSMGRLQSVGWEIARYPSSFFGFHCL